MMKRFILASLAVVLLLAGIGYLVYYRGIYVDFKPEVSVTAHFRTQGKEIQYLDGDTWKTMEIRGVDLSSNIPGEAMLDFVPVYEDYSRWLEQIGEMGANTIRVHTVMDDDFYEAFYDYNTTKEKPLYLLQGLSVPDRANYGAEDIYQEEFVDLLLENATKAVDVIHGNRAIELGNFTGTGWYQWDVSPWTLGYLLGQALGMGEMPSVGMTHLPTAFLMAQSLWHSLPIWVTSTSVSPMRRWVPMGRCLRSMPRVLIFSANTPAFREMGQTARMVSTLSSARRLICRCQSPAWASPTMP